MEKKLNWKQILLRSLSYVLVAVLASVLTLGLVAHSEDNKLAVLKNLLLQCYIGDADEKTLTDAAADAMVEALGDRWSYYIPADQYGAHVDNKANSYVGIGVTIQVREEKDGLLVKQVEPGSGAHEAGIQPGDVITEAAGQSLAGLTTAQTKPLISGDEGTTVELTVLREGEKLTFQVLRKRITVVVASGQMLADNIGLVTIQNFNSNCAKETMAAVNALVDQGAKALIFDVRNNPGGYKDELVKVLDQLLPEGDLFRSINFAGIQSVDKSDKKCLELPMAVLCNGSSYSAAEFFAAALEEYDWAIVVGQPTTGKGYFQNTLELPDGSAVNLSVGKYFTPKGVSLADVGGLVPDIVVEVDEKTAAMIASDLLKPEEDPQIQAAVKALLEGVKP